eukprot:gene8665-6472_t
MTASLRAAINAAVTARQAAEAAAEYESEGWMLLPVLTELDAPGVET